MATVPRRVSKAAVQAAPLTPQCFDDVAMGRLPCRFSSFSGGLERGWQARGQTTPNSDKLTCLRHERASTPAHNSAWGNMCDVSPATIGATFRPSQASDLSSWTTATSTLSDTICYVWAFGNVGEIINPTYCNRDTYIVRT